MTALLLLVLLAPDLPLGPFARPGVPVLLRSDAPEDVTLDDWPYRVEGVTPVHPPRVPCAVRDAAGAEVATLSPPPPGGLLAIVGDAPPDVRGVRIRIDGLAAEHWRALDVFDRVLVTAGEEVAPVLLEWARAGGSVVVVGEAPAIRGLGEVVAVSDLGAFATLAPPRLAIPRPGNVRPDVYDLVPAPRAAPPALATARWLAAAAGLAMALQLALYAAGRLGARRLLAGLGVVAAAGGGIALVRAPAEYAPVVRCRIVVDFEGGAAIRRRTYLVDTAVGPGAEVRPDPLAAPLFYRGAGRPWWTGPDRACRFEEGVLRAFVTEDVVPGPGSGGAGPVPAALAARETPEGWVASGRETADPGVFLHVRVAPQR